MIRINLAPEYVPESNPAAFYAGMVLFLICAGAAYYAPIYYSEKIASESADIRAKTEEKKNQLNKLKLDIERINSLKTKLEDVKNRAQRIRVLGADRKQPVLFLDKIQTLHMDKLWLTSLELKSGTKLDSYPNETAPVGAEAIVKGVTYDHGLVSEYAKRVKIEFQTAGVESGNGYKDYVPPFLENNDDSEEGDLDNETVALSKRVKNIVKNTPVTPILINEIVLRESKLNVGQESKQKLSHTTFEYSLNTNMMLD
jgi:hypothetical protein